MNKSELVFVLPPAISHMVATIELSKRLINKDDRVLVTILCITTASNPVLESLTKSLVGSETRIKLIDLPQIDPPPPELMLKSKERYICANIENHIPHVRNTLKNLVSSHSNSHSNTRVSGLVLDFVCMSLLDVANELGLPCYMFLTCSLGFLSVMLHLPTHHDLIGAEFKDSDPDVTITGLANPVPARVLPLALFNKDGGYTAFLELARRFRKTKGILVNSFVELESHDAVRSLRSDGKTPPIYMVGPIVDLKGPPHPSMDQAQHENIMKWLDKQPDSSVLFICFGSSGQDFGASQLREIAFAVERSGYRFLWILRSRQKLTKSSTTEDITLPEGFLERTKGRGMICKWAPQVKVLAHKAVGGFVSHCGWNSILESLWCGVPIATWPFYAEQQLNAFEMVRELGLAVELRLDHRMDGGGDVMAEEIEIAVRRLMDGESELRKKVKERSKMARNALAEGGSSFNALGQLIKDVIARSE